MRRKIRGTRVLLTGASSGIGKALAAELAERGARLVITARREQALCDLAESLRKAYNAEVWVVAGDITDSATRSELIRTASERLGGIDLLVNNAGVGATGWVEAIPEETARRLMEINFFAPLFLTQAAIPFLKESAKNKERSAAGICPMVVQIGSVVGFRGTPHYGVYGASKAALINLADAERAELAADGVEFLTVNPGTTTSEFFDALLENRSMPHFPDHSRVTPEQVAKKIAEAIEKGKHRIIPHRGSRILDLMNRFCPFLTDRIMTWYR